MQLNDHYEQVALEDTGLPIKINLGLTLTPQNTLSLCSFSWHEQIEVLFFHKGSAIVSCGDKLYNANSGDIFLINPFEIHLVIYDRDPPCYDCLMIDVTRQRGVQKGNGEMPYFDLLMSGHIRFEHQIPSDTEAAFHIRAICNEWRSKTFGYELSVKARVFALFACLFRNHIDGDDNGSEWQVQNIERYDRIRPALEYMQKHFSERILLEMLAQVCNISPAHFCRLFRQITRTTPTRYLNDLRLHEAYVRLKKSDKSIAEISSEVGFEDAGYLSSCFKSRFGMTPLQMKKQYQQ